VIENNDISYEGRNENVWKMKYNMTMKEMKIVLFWYENKWYWNYDMKIMKEEANVLMKKRNDIEPTMMTLLIQ